MPANTSFWARKDLQRIRSRFFAHDLTPAETAYLRAWALLLLSSDLDVDEEDRHRLRSFVDWLDSARQAKEDSAA